MCCKICKSCHNSFESKTNNGKYCQQCKTLLCQQCNKVFITDNIKRQYCSVECANNSKLKPKTLKKCCICDNNFEFKVTYKKQKTCSYKCATIWKRQENKFNFNKTPAKIEKCVNCEQEFIIKEKNQKYCTLSCSYEFKKLQTKNKQIKCSRESCCNLINPSRKYCSHSCANSVNTKKRGRSGIYKICQNCGDTFYVQQNQISYNFCSAMCGNISRRDKPNYNGRRRQTIACENCNIDFEIQDYRSSTAKFCSKKCFELAQPQRVKYNKQSIPIIEQYGKENGYIFQHAENGGEFHLKELGYWADGYDKEKNVWIEYDEKHHYDSFGNLKEKDVKRQVMIVNYLNCKFIRIKYDKQTSIFNN